ncbi:MAG: DUF1882 domain-containing protein [Candidatus Bathyarchaeia archaeon]|nr:DUF1882 domain-containing protein [Candidatus Bathyarchaeia archaeon]
MSDSQNHYKTSFGDTFFRLWVSRHSAYAIQQPDGCYLKVDEPLTIEVIQKHLKGEITVGLYQLDRASQLSNVSKNHMDFLVSKPTVTILNKDGSSMDVLVSGVFQHL